MQARTIRLLFGLTLLLVAAAATAEDIYQWKDANGVTHYSQTPPPSGDYKTHAARAGDRANKAAPVVASAPAESAQCSTARKNIAMLEGKDAVQQDTDGDGKPDKTLSDADRGNQLELARAMLKANCASAAPAR